MKSLSVAMLAVLLFFSSDLHAKKTTITITIECCPLRIIVTGKTSAAMTASAAPEYRAKGTAYVEGGDLVIELDRGTAPPPEGLVVDASAQVSVEVAAKLGLTRNQKLRPGKYLAAPDKDVTSGGRSGKMKIRIPLHSQD